MICSPVGYVVRLKDMNFYVDAHPEIGRKRQIKAEEKYEIQFQKISMKKLLLKYDRTGFCQLWTFD
jgi:hypothetical protein